MLPLLSSKWSLYGGQGTACDVHDQEPQAYLMALHPDRLSSIPRKRPRQMTLEESSLPPPNNVLKEKNDPLLLRWLVRSGRPISLVRDPELKEIARNSGWVLPSEETLKSILLLWRGYGAVPLT